MATPPFDTSQFPGGDLDPEKVDDAAGQLEVQAVQVRAQGQWVVTTWSGLRECYRAPEAEQLLAVMGPVGKETDRYADDLGVVAKALHDLADDYRAVIERRGRLVTEAEEFNANADWPEWASGVQKFGEWMNAGRPQWQGQMWTAAEYDRIIGALNKLATDLAEVEERCALKIRKVDGPQYLGAGAANYWSGANWNAPEPQIEQPWGPPIEWSLLTGLSSLGSYYEGAFVDGLWGAVTDAGAMVGLDGQESFTESWEGIAELLGRDPETGEWWQGDVAGEAAIAAAKGAVAWDLWDDDPARALGNVALLAVPGVGAVKVVTALRTAGKAGRAARALPDVDTPRSRPQEMLDRVLDAATSDRALNIAGKFDQAVDPLGTLADYGFQKTKNLLSQIDFSRDAGGTEIPAATDPGSARLPDPAQIPNADQSRPAPTLSDDVDATNDNPLPARDRDAPVNPRSSGGNESGSSGPEEYQPVRNKPEEAAAENAPTARLSQDANGHPQPRAEAAAEQGGLLLKDRPVQGTAEWGEPRHGHGPGEGGPAQGGSGDADSSVGRSDRPDGETPARNGEGSDADASKTGNGADDDTAASGDGRGDNESAEGHGDGGAHSDGTTGDSHADPISGDQPGTGAGNDLPDRAGVVGPSDDVVWRGGEGVELTGREKLVVDEALDAARQAEPAITASLKDIVGDHPGVGLAGLEDRVRPGGSVYWDVASHLKRVPDEGVDGLVAQTTDILRYRMVVDTGGASFADTAQVAVDDLARAGYRPVGAFDQWQPGGTQVGVTSRWMSPDGQMLEIQWHTPDSVRAADQLDMLDRSTRDPLLSPEQVEQSRWQQAQLAAQVPRPYDAGALELPELPGFRDRADGDSGALDDGGWPTPSGKELAGTVPGGSGRAVHAESAEQGVLDEFVRQEFPHLADVNSAGHEAGQAGYLRNCTRAALAGDLSLGGKNVIAHPSAAARPITDISDALGGQWRHADGYDAVVDRMDELGDGARGIVAIDRGAGKVGHVLNVVQSDRHGTVFLDAQTGKIANLDPGDRLYFLETAPGDNLGARFRTADAPGMSPLTDAEHDSLLEAAGQRDPAGSADALTESQAPSGQTRQEPGFDMDDGGDDFGSPPTLSDENHAAIAKRFPAPDVNQTLISEPPSAQKAFAGRDDLLPNTMYEVPERNGRFYTDDTGRVVHVEISDYGKKGNLNYDLMNPQPDVTYIVKEHVFVTDHAGRTVEAYAPELDLGEADRSESVQRRVGASGGPGRDGGHLLANMFGGGPDAINLISQIRWQNQGNGGTGDTWWHFEEELASLLDPDKNKNESNWTKPDITVRVLPQYHPGDTTPYRLVVRYTIDGLMKTRRFSNE